MSPNSPMSKRRIGAGMTKHSKTYLWLSILAIALIVYQVRLLNMTTQYVGLQDIDVLKKEVAELELNVNQSELGLVALRDKLDTMKGLTSERELIDHLNQEIERYKMYAGLTEIVGEGVVIIVNDADRALLDTETPNDLVVHDQYLREIVEDLRIAGAEAISVNGTRIITGITEIICNGPTIRINGIQQAQPFIIRAIGDRYKLAAMLQDTESLTHALKRRGFAMEVNTQVQLTIDKLQKPAQYKYATLIQ